MNLIKYFEKKYNKKIKNFDRKIWEEISRSKKPYLTEDFIRKFQDKVVCHQILTCQKLSKKFVDELQNNNNWAEGARYQILSGNYGNDCSPNIKPKSNKFSEKYLRKLERFDWSSISKDEKMSNEFIMKNIDKIDIDSLVLNKKIKLSESCKLLLITKYPEYKDGILKL